LVPTLAGTDIFNALHAQITLLAIKVNEVFSNWYSNPEALKKGAQSRCFICSSMWDDEYTLTEAQIDEKQGFRNVDVR
jgi:hypothetical protein